MSTAVIANAVKNILLQRRMQDGNFVYPINVSSFKKNPQLATALKNNNIQVAALTAPMYNAILANLNGQTATINLDQTSSMSQQPDSQFLPQNSSQQQSGLANSQSLNLKGVGGNSLQAFWGNYVDYDQGAKNSDGIKQGISTNSINGIKLPALRAVAQKILSTPKVDYKPAWVQNQRLNEQSAQWNSIPAATFKDGKWRSKFFKAPPSQQKQKKALNKKQNLLQKYIGVTTSTQNFVYPLLQTLNKVLTSNGYQGMGSISAKGVPMYIGRFYDPVTKKIKTISKPKITINPYDWNQVYNKTVLQLAANWNQFVRGAQRLTSHIRNKNQWNNQVAKKRMNNTVSERRYKQMAAAMKKIYQGRFAPFNVANQNQKKAFMSAIKNWKYQDFANVVQEVAKNKLQDKVNLSPGQQLKWTSYSTWRQNPVIASRINQAKSKIMQPGLISYNNLVAGAKGSQGFNQETKAQSIKDVFKKIQRKGIKKIPRISVAQIKKLAQQVKNDRPGALIDITLAKKLKAQTPLPKFNKAQLNSMYDQITGSQSSSVLQPPSQPISNMFGNLNPQFFNGNQQFGNQMNIEPQQQQMIVQG